MALLRPILHAVYGRERDESMGAAGALGVTDALADVTAEDLAPLLAGSAAAMEELARAHVLEAVGALLEDAVCTLRRKSRALAEREREAGPAKAEPAKMAAQEEGKEAEAAAAPKPASTTPWLDREASWRVRAVLDAMALPRELADVPDTLYWAAALIEACEAAVAYSPSRLIAAAVLRRLADHERALDASLAILEAGRGEARGRKKPPPTEALVPLDNPALTYCPPDPRRIDPEALAIARKVLARGSSDLAQGKVDVAVRAPSAFGAASFMPAAGAEMQEPVLPTRGFLASPNPAGAAAGSPSARYEAGQPPAAPLPAAIRELVIPPRGEEAGASGQAAGAAAAGTAEEAAPAAQAAPAAPAEEAAPAASPAQPPQSAPQPPQAAPQPPQSAPQPPQAAPQPAPPAPSGEDAEVQDLMRDIL
jgi:hypothetical protein